MKKIKVTIFEYGQTRAVIMTIDGWWNLDTAMNNNGIITDNVIKIEVVLDAGLNVIDTTKEE